MFDIVIYLKQDATEKSRLLFSYSWDLNYYKFDVCGKKLIKWLWSDKVNFFLCIKMTHRFDLVFRVCQYLKNYLQNTTEIFTHIQYQLLLSYITYVHLWYKKSVFNNKGKCATMKQLLSRVIFHRKPLKSFLRQIS